MNQNLYTRSSLAPKCPPTAAIETAAEEAHRKLQNLKRLTKLKASRVAPSSSPDEPDSTKENIIDDEILERCTRCPLHRKRKGKFRPLIGNNGEFLCDPCYQTEFPATAFLDDTEMPEWQRRGSKITDKFRNKVTDLMADAMGATEAPDERFNNDDIEFSSELECRMCLEKGAYRSCCSSYYCNACYFQRGKCPGCEQETPLTGIAASKKEHPGKRAIWLSWAISILVILLAITFLGLLYFNEVTSPHTVWGHSCRGFFATCDLAVCIDYDGGHGYGEGGSWVPAAEPFRVCNRETTVNQIVGSACIYDHEMYTWSNRLMGYDLCLTSPREERSRPTNVSLFNPLLLYGETAGVYVFDDDFEFPIRTASAPWIEMVNAEYSDACGVNSSPPERGNHGGFEPVENKHALVFTGVHVRRAVTEGVNVEHGGVVEFHLKMGPLSNNPSATCKAAYDGDVTVEYCMISKDECVKFGFFPAWKYRGDTFHFLSVEIPYDAWSNSTSFRFRQESFDSSRDHWAIDDVRIRANLQPNWQESSAFVQRQRITNSDVRRGACCYGTDKCSVFDKKDTNFQTSECDIIPGFASDKPISRLKSSELYILFCLFAFLAKFAYQRVFDHYTSMTRTDKNSNFVEQTTRSDQFPKMTFHTITQLTWQYTMALILACTLTCVLLRLFSTLDGAKCFYSSCNIDGSFICVSVIALAFDMRAIRYLLTTVLVIEKPMEFLVDLHPDRGILQVERRCIPLADVSAMKRQSAGFSWLLSLCYGIAALPIGLGSLTLRSFHLQGTSEVWYTLLGIMAILREIFEVSFIAKFFMCIRQILACGQGDREDFGRAVRRKGLSQQFAIGASLMSIVAMSTLFARRIGNMDSEISIIAFSSCVLFGGLFGILIGIMHGLPVVPEAYLTCWPSECYSITYYDRSQCPCLFSCTSCGEMNSRQVLLVVTVNEMPALEKMLSGSFGTITTSEET